MSVICSIFSVFGIFASHNDLVDPTTGVRGPEHQTLGVYGSDEDMNNGWRWSVGWIMCAVFFAIHVPMQKGNPRALAQWLPPRIEDDETDPYDDESHHVKATETEIPK